MRTKCCSGCKEEKPISEFNRKGKSKWQSRCRPCNSEYCKAHYKKHPNKAIERNRKRKETLKPIARQIVIDNLITGCVDCGEKDILVLDFDHIDNKKYSISYIVASALSIDKLHTEIAKCVVRCANCHRRKTAKDFNWWRANIGE